jgi:hypothetical protein
MQPSIWSQYLYALKPPVSKEKYQKRLKFFDFIGLGGQTAEKKSECFMQMVSKEGIVLGF